MRKIVLSTAALGAFAAPAFAADLPARAPAQMVAAIYDWSGLYIGANGGWGQSHNCWDFVLVAGHIDRRRPSPNVGGRRFLIKSTKCIFHFAPHYSEGVKI